MPMALGSEDHHISVDEPGAYGIMISTEDGIVVHTEDFTLTQADITAASHTPVHKDT